MLDKTWRVFPTEGVDPLVLGNPVRETDPEMEEDVDAVPKVGILSGGVV